tara:strand:+ start:82 stop:258 length:177 start_codon:yes stop_codon:yes gene_type:complete
VISFLVCNWRVDGEDERKSLAKRLNMEDIWTKKAEYIDENLKKTWGPGEMKLIWVWCR